MGRPAGERGGVTTTARRHGATAIELTVAIGSIIAAVAVLLIHMDTAALAVTKAMSSGTGRPCARASSVRAILLWRPVCSILDASTRVPKNKQMLSLK